MRIAIVDDNLDFLMIVQTMILKYCFCNIEQCDVIQTPQGMLEKLEHGQYYDVYILDIEMPQMSGLDLAKQIRLLQENAYIIFLTSYTNYALTSYDIHICTYQYIIKDHMKKKLPEILEKIELELGKKWTEFYYIKNNSRYEKIKIVDIIYIYKEGKNSIFVTEKKDFRERIALKEVMSKLKKDEFAFFDNGRIVNLRYVNCVDKESIILLDKYKLYGSYLNIKKIKEKIVDYWSNDL